MAPEHARYELAIRAIVVTTRAAVRSHHQHGTADGVDATRRGLHLLDELAARVAPDADDTVRERLAAAREEIRALVPDRPGADAATE